MRSHALWGFLPVVLLPSAVAQSYGNSGGNAGSGQGQPGGIGSSSPGSTPPGSSGPGNGSGIGPGSSLTISPVVLTCPIVPPSTVFITVTPPALSTVTVTTVSIGSYAPNGAGLSLSHIGSSPSRTVTIPCSTSVGPVGAGQPGNGASATAAQLTTDYVTMSMPPLGGQTVGSMITYTIITPLVSGSHTTNAPVPSVISSLPSSGYGAVQPSSTPTQPGNPAAVGSQPSAQGFPTVTITVTAPQSSHPVSNDPGGYGSGSNPSGGGPSSNPGSNGSGTNPAGNDSGSSQGTGPNPGAGNNPDSNGSGSNTGAGVNPNFGGNPSGFGGQGQSSPCETVTTTVNPSGGIPSGNGAQSSTPPPGNPGLPNSGPGGQGLPTFPSTITVTVPSVPNGTAKPNSNGGSGGQVSPSGGYGGSGNHPNDPDNTTTSTLIISSPVTITVPGDTTSTVTPPGSGQPSGQGGQSPVGNGGNGGNAGSAQGSSAGAIGATPSGSYGNPNDGSNEPGGSGNPNTPGNPGSSGTPNDPNGPFGSGPGFNTTPGPINPASSSPGSQIGTATIPEPTASGHYGAGTGNGASEPNGSGPGTPDGSNPNGSNPNGSNPNGSNPNGSNPNGSNPNGGNPNGSGAPITITSPASVNPTISRAPVPVMTSSPSFTGGQGHSDIPGPFTVTVSGSPNGGSPPGYGGSSPAGSSVPDGGSPDGTNSNPNGSGSGSNSPGGQGISSPVITITQASILPYSSTRTVPAPVPNTPTVNTAPTNGPGTDSGSQPSNGSGDPSSGGSSPCPEGSAITIFPSQTNTPQPTRAPLVTVTGNPNPPGASNPLGNSNPTTGASPIITIPGGSNSANANPSGVPVSVTGEPSSSGESTPCTTSSSASAIQTSNGASFDLSSIRIPQSTIPSSGWNATISRTIAGTGVIPLTGTSPSTVSPLATTIPIDCPSLTSTLISSSMITWCATLGVTSTIETGGTTPIPIRRDTNTSISVLPTSSPGGYQWGGKKNEVCGGAADSGNFTLKMDDLLVHRVRSDVVGPAQMFNPYHRFWFTSNFKVASTDGRFQPSSGSSMLQSNPHDDSVGTQQARIGSDPSRSSDCFMFNFFGAHLGCDSEESKCVFTFTGMAFDPISNKEERVVSQVIDVPACRQTMECSLQHIAVNGFSGLSSVVVEAKVDGEERTWWADDIELGWADNTCDKVKCRSQLRDSVLTKSPGRRWIA